MILNLSEPGFGMIKGFAGYLVYQSFQSIKSFKSWFRQITNVGFSLFGKASHCECGDRVLFPEPTVAKNLSAFRNLTGLNEDLKMNKKVQPSPLTLFICEEGLNGP